MRRFQNKDGSLTKAGEHRYSSEDREARKARIKKIAKGAAIAGAVAGAGYLAYRGYKGNKANAIRNLASRASGPKTVLGLPQKKNMELSIIGKSSGSRGKKGRTAKEALEYLHRRRKPNVSPKARKGRTAKEAMAYLDKMHQAKGQKRPTETVDYESLKKKYDKFSKAVNQQQTYIRRVNKKL